MKKSKNAISPKNVRAQLLNLQKQFVEYRDILNGLNVYKCPKCGKEFCSKDVISAICVDCELDFQLVVPLR